MKSDPGGFFGLNGNRALFVRPTQEGRKEALERAESHKKEKIMTERGHC